MDFDFGNLVYILITLAFVIFSAKKSKKKPQVRPVLEKPDNEPILKQNPEDYLKAKS